MQTERATLSLNADIGIVKPLTQVPSISRKPTMGNKRCRNTEIKGKINHLCNISNNL